MKKIFTTSFVLLSSQICFAEQYPNVNNIAANLPLIILCVIGIGVFLWYTSAASDGTLDKAIDKTEDSIKAGAKKIAETAKSVKEYSQDSITKAKLKKREQELEIELLKKKIRKMEEDLKD